MATSLPITRFHLDPTGVNPDNAVHGEVHTLITGRPVRAICMEYGSFFTESLVVVDNLTSSLLIPDIDYQVVELNQAASALYSKEICVVVLITNPAITQISVDYQALGGPYERNSQTLVDIMNNLMVDDRPVAWPDIIGKPDRFMPNMHLHDIGDTYGWEFICYALERIRNAILLSDSPALESVLQYVDESIESLREEIDDGSALAAHIDNKNNPHETTKVQVGLGNVNNYTSLTSAHVVQYFNPYLEAVNQPPEIKGVQRHVSSDALLAYHEKMLPAATLRKRDGNYIPRDTLVYSDINEINSSEASNSIQIHDGRLYVGNKAPATSRHIFVDAVIGIDTPPAHPDYEAKAGMTGDVTSSGWPFKTIKAALEKGVPNVDRFIFLREGQEHDVVDVVGDQTILRGGKITFKPYGNISGSGYETIDDRKSTRSLNTRISLNTEIREYPTGVFLQYTSSLWCTEGTEVVFNAVKLLVFKETDPSKKVFDHNQAIRPLGKFIKVIFTNSTVDYGTLATAQNQSNEIPTLELMRPSLPYDVGSRVNSKLHWENSNLVNALIQFTFLFRFYDHGFEFKFYNRTYELDDLREEDIYKYVGRITKKTYALPDLDTNVPVTSFQGQPTDGWGGGYRSAFGFSSTDNSITGADIVSFLELEVGDVIGFYADNPVADYGRGYMTVDEIINNSKIIVNKAHLTATPAGPKVLGTGTASGLIRRLAKWYNASPDLGRSWINVTRTVGTSYFTPGQSTWGNGRGMYVSVTNSGTDAGVSIHLADSTLGGTWDVVFNQDVNPAVNSNGQTLTILVPGSHQYKYEHLSSGTAGMSFRELR